MGIPNCAICGLLMERCKQNPLCPRGVLTKHEWHLISVKNGNNHYYVKMSDAVEAMKEFALNYHAQFLTRKVIIEKTKKK